MRLNFDASQQIAICDGKEIPSLRRPEIAREVGVYLPGKYLGISNAHIFQKIPNNPEKTVKLLSSGHFDSFSLVANFSAPPPRF